MTKACPIGMRDPDSALPFPVRSRYRTKRGYWQVSVHNKYRSWVVTMKEHQAVWQCCYGDIPKGKTIHHVNGDKGDNRIENLQCLSLENHAVAHTKPLPLNLPLHSNERFTETYRVAYQDDNAGNKHLLQTSAYPAGFRASGDCPEGILRQEDKETAYLKKYLGRLREMDTRLLSGYPIAQMGSQGRVVAYP